MKCIFSFLLLLIVAALDGQQLRSPAPGESPLLPAEESNWVARTPTYYQVDFPKGISIQPAKQGTAAQKFLTTYGASFGLTPADEMQEERSTPGLRDETYLRYRRLRQDVPVLGQLITVRVGANGSILGVSGNTAPETAFAPATAPTVSTSTLADKAKYSLTSRYPYAEQWDAIDKGLCWVSPNPWRAAASDKFRLTRAFEVVEPAGSRAEMVYVDQATGRVVFRHQLHCDLNRRLYDGTTAVRSIWEEGFAFPGNLGAEDQEMLRATAETYHLYHRTFGRLGYDGADRQMRQIVRAYSNSRLQCPNARALGNNIWHCEGVVSDDIVGHEWTHNYLAEMNGLLYEYQSGAINEAYSDIFGEVIDLINGRGDDTDDQLPRTGCDDTGLRWKLGEDAAYFDTTEYDTGIRDLWQPECYDDPSSMDSEYFVCPPTRNIHINNGIVNRTFSLLADGGTLNGDTVVGIGLTRALHVFFHAADKYMVPVTDFNALGIMLKQSAQDLRGIDLPALTVVDLPVAFSGDTITAFDSLQIEKAIRATQLMEMSPCVGVPTLAQSPPETCAAATTSTFVPLLTEDWENGIPSTWTVVENPVHPETWDPKPWVSRSVLPNNRPGKGVFAENGNVGNCQSDLDNGTIELTSPVITLPLDQNEFLLRFDHYYSIQEFYDGGVLLYARNGEGFIPVPNEAFLYNGYDNPTAAPGLNDNPLAGINAFQGADQNSNTGTWGTSIVDLSDLGVLPGDELQLRWSLGMDGCDGWLGWYLDEVSIGFCGEAALPVTYQAFTATPDKDHILLNWTTSTETDNAGFHVERSLANTGAAFEAIGFVPASPIAGDYSYADFQVSSGQTYVYRLRQRDLDGTTAYSELVSARLENADQFLVFPNPAEERFQVLVPASVGQVSLLDGTGRIVAKQTASAGRAVFSVSTFPAGIYLLRAGSLVRRVVVR